MVTIEQIQPLIESIKGASMVALDVSYRKQGTLVRETGLQAVIYNSRVSGYEAKVRRETGLESFEVGNLPWGERIVGSLINHHGSGYLQCIVTRRGTRKYISYQTEIPKPSWFKEDSPWHGVFVNTFKLENIDSIRLKGQTLGTPHKVRDLLSIKA